MGFFKEGLSRKSFFRARRKGVSEVVATILLVMITVVLVSFVNGTFTRLAQSAGTSTEKALETNRMISQRMSIPTAYGCGPYVCFELKSLGTNTMSLPMEKAGYYLNGEPREVLAWTGPSIGVNCGNNPVLAPGQSCYGKVLGPCGVGGTFSVVQSWGIETFKVVSICR